MKPQRRRYLVLLLLSLALHTLLYLLFLFFLEEENKKKVEQTFQVSLRQKPKNVKIPVEESLEQTVLSQKKEEADQEPSPIDNSDEMSTNNQDKDIKGTVIGGGLISKEKKLESTSQPSLEQAIDKSAKLIDKVDVIELKKPETLKQDEQIKEVEKLPELLTSKSTYALKKPTEIFPSYLDPIENISAEGKKQGQVEPSYFEELSGVKEKIGENFQSEEIDRATDLSTPGNILMLADAQLSEVTVPQPFSDKKSKELKLVNQYLNRMNNQVMAYWINPYRGNKKLKGIIHIQLNTQGYLVNSYVYRESGDKILDISVLDAIRAVRRFEVPNNAIITERYYQKLNFHYNSIEQEIELMPFETESPTKQEN
jgi:hypothetical protein